MRMNMELGRFVEFQCDRCGDVAYAKQSDEQYTAHVLSW